MLDFHVRRGSESATELNETKLRSITKDFKRFGEVMI